MGKLIETHNKHVKNEEELIEVEDFLGTLKSLGIDLSRKLDI